MHGQFTLDFAAGVVNRSLARELADQICTQAVDQSRFEGVKSNEPTRLEIPDVIGLFCHERNLKARTFIENRPKFPKRAFLVGGELQSRNSPRCWPGADHFDVVQRQCELFVTLAL